MSHPIISADSHVTGPPSSYGVAFRSGGMMNCTAHTGSRGGCWTATYSTPITNDAGEFRGQSDLPH